MNDLFSIKTIQLSQISIPPDLFDLIDLCKKNGRILGKSLFDYYRYADSKVFDKLETAKQIAFGHRWFYYYKLEKILLLSKDWNKNKKWKNPIFLEPSVDITGNVRYFVHLGSDRFTVMRLFGLKESEFVVLHDRKNLDLDGLEVLKNLYQDDEKMSLELKISKKTGFPCLHRNIKNWEDTDDRKEINKWLSSNLDFWEFIRS
jgi:hypothetical protein